MKIKLFATDVDGTLTDGRFTIDSFGNETKTFNVKDGVGALILKQHDILFAVLTNHKSDIVKNRMIKLHADYYLDDCSNKLDALTKIINDNNLSFDQVAYIGDDINDLELLNHVGVSGCPSDAVDIIKSNCKYVCKRNGGYGAFREFVEYVIKTMA